MSTRASIERKKIHAIHKANIMKLSDGLFLRCSRNVAKEYPEITYGEHIVDNTCMQLVMNPYQYDMLLMENLYGDILSDLCAGLVGGLGLVPGANLGDGVRDLRSGARVGSGHRGQESGESDGAAALRLLMLRHIGEPGGGSRAGGAGEGLHREEDAHARRGPTAGTRAFADAVIDALHTIPPPKPVLQEVEL